MPLLPILPCVVFRAPCWAWDFGTVKDSIVYRMEEKHSLRFADCSFTDSLRIVFNPQIFLFGLHSFLFCFFNVSDFARLETKHGLSRSLYFCWTPWPLRCLVPPQGPEHVKVRRAACPGPSSPTDTPRPVPGKFSQPRPSRK